MSRNRMIAVALAAGAVLRVVYLLSSRGLPFFDFPITDALYHHRLAQAIASGDLWDGQPFFRAPLYPYLLGGLYALFGPHVVIGKILGHVAGLVTGGLVIAWSDKLWGRRGALWAALLWLGSGLLCFYEGELLVDSVFTCLLFASLYVLGESRGRTRFLLLSGALFGLSAVMRATSLVCVPLLLFWVRQSTPRTRGLWVWMLATAIPVGAVVGLNSFALGRPTGIATSGGVNFYIGNHEGADGCSAVLPEPWGYAWSYRDLSEYASGQAGRALDAGEVSDYYYDLGVRFLREHPAQAFRLAVRKAVLSVGRLSLSNDLNIPFVLERLPVLRVLAVRVAWLVVLAAAGLLWVRRLPPQARWLWGYVLSYAVVLVAYFTNERFRLPLVPALIVLSAGVPVLWLQAMRAERAGALLLASLGALVAFPNWYGLTDDPAQAYFNLGNVALRRGDPREAREWYDSAATLRFDLRQLHLNRGLAHLRAGDGTAARADFAWEAGRFPYDARPFNNLAALELIEGDTVSALAAIDSGLARDSSLILLYLQRMRVAAAGGDALAMERDLRSARARSGPWPVWTYWEGEIAMLRGQTAKARECYAAYRLARNPWPNLDTDDFWFTGPGGPQVDYGVGLTYLSERNLDSAEAWFARAALADSSFAEAWSNWGTAAVARGEFPQALERYRQALQTQPRSPLFLTNLAWAQLAMGQRDSAMSSLRRALEFDSLFEPAALLLKQAEASP